jgi:para-aminobenzoate synthetase component 1
MTLSARGGIVRLVRTGDAEPFLQREADPLELLTEILGAIRKQLPAPGPKNPKPSFPVALVAASFEFGRAFPPHEDCFPASARAREDDFFAAIFLDAYKPDTQGGTERIGYSGRIPADWIPGAPELLTRSTGHDAPPLHAHPFVPRAEAALRPALTPQQHAESVRRIQQYLAAGDIYQANLTVPFHGGSTVPPEAAFDRALKRGGATYGGMMILPTGTLVSLSPELYLRRRGRQIETRPIKGTRRIPTRAGGAAEAREFLLTSDKDRAEHIMIVDLERNDLGRLCEPGSVVVDPLLRIVEDPTLMHLESVVKGTLRAGVTLSEIFGATFPGGSVTGAPKRRALQILAELEPEPRGIYCGAFGWIDADGDMDLNLPIRTALFQPDGTVYYAAGGGIVADSTADQEWRELMDKTAFFESLL